MCSSTSPYIDLLFQCLVVSPTLYLLSNKGWQENFDTYEHLCGLYHQNLRGLFTVPLGLKLGNRLSSWTCSRYLRHTFLETKEYRSQFVWLWMRKYFICLKSIISNSFSMTLLNFWIIFRLFPMKIISLSKEKWTLHYLHVSLCIGHVHTNIVRICSSWSKYQCHHSTLEELVWVHILPSSISTLSFILLSHIPEWLFNINFFLQDSVQKCRFHAHLKYRPSILTC